NLFNLIPVWQLDGARITSVLSPGNWDFVLVSLLLIAIKAPSGAVWTILIIMFIIRLGKGGYTRYTLATPMARARMATVLLVLCLSLGYGMELTQRVSPAGASSIMMSGDEKSTASDMPARRRSSAVGLSTEEQLTAVVAA